MDTRLLLRLEGLAALAVATFAYHRLGANWWLFAGAFLAPDLTLFGYLAGPRLGALAYNLGHTYLLALGLVAAGWFGGSPLTVALGVIWVAHIGFDRALGYGLKLPSDFHDTHLGRIGRAKAQARAD